jgi:preprotein translocase subunit Sss1
VAEKLEKGVYNLDRWRRILKVMKPKVYKKPTNENYIRKKSKRRGNGIEELVKMLNHNPK